MGVGWEDALGLWDGNPIKLDCDDHCTSINVINSLSNKKIKKKQKNNRIRNKWVLNSKRKYRQDSKMKR